MAYEKMNSLDTEKVFTLGGVDSKTGEKFPTEVEGFYLGFKNITNQEGLTSKIHVFKTSKGNVGIWGKAALDSELGNATLGAMTKVVSLGKKKIAGGKTKYMFEFYQDKEVTISVPKSAASAQFDTSNDEELDSVEGEDQEYTDGEDEEAIQNAALAAVEKKKRVEALLNGKSAKK